MPLTLSFSTAMTPKRLTRRRAFCCTKSCLLVTAKETWVFDELAAGQRGKSFQPYVNADFLIGRRQEFRLDGTGETNEPLAVGSANGTGLDRALDGAVQSNGDIANFG